MSQRGVQKLKMCGSQDYERGYTPIYLVLGTFLVKSKDGILLLGTALFRKGGTVLCTTADQSPSIFSRTLALSPHNFQSTIEQC